MTDELIFQYIGICTPDEEDTNILQVCKDAAMEYIEEQTGLRKKNIENKKTLRLCYLILINDFFNNRNLLNDKENINPWVKDAISANNVNLI